MKLMIILISLVMSSVSYASTCNQEVTNAIKKEVGNGATIVTVTYKKENSIAPFLKVYNVSTRPVRTNSNLVGFEGISSWYVVVRSHPTFTPSANPTGEPESCTVESIILYDTAV